jgi:hypothetical protein
MSVLVATEKEISQIISDAQQAATAARHETDLFESLAYFTSDSVRLVDSAVASKITLSDVNYSTLVSSISAATSSPKPAATPVSQKPQPGPGGPPPPPAPLQSITDAIKVLQASATRLKLMTAALKEETTKFGLGIREQEVTACIKAI